MGTKGIPHLVTHDARTIRYPDPLIKVNDTIQIDLETGKITDFIKFDTGLFPTSLTGSHEGGFPGALEGERVCVCVCVWSALCFLSALRVEWRHETKDKSGTLEAALILTHS